MLEIEKGEEQVIDFTAVVLLKTLGETEGIISQTMSQIYSFFPHDASPPTPTPTPLSKPPPDHSICKRPESYFLALALPPLHTSSLPKYPTRRIESQLTKIQPPEVSEKIHVGVAVPATRF